MKGQITSSTFFKYLLNVIVLANSAHQTMLKEAAGEVNEFISKIGTAESQQTVELQTKLIDALKKFTFTWSCYENQVKIIAYVVE